MKKLMTTLAVLLGFAAIPATAGVIQHNNVDCGGFSSCTDANFLAAVGGGPLDVFLDFSALGSGGAIDGSTISSDVVFSSVFSSAFGGSNSTSVQYSGSGASAEIGPVGSWDGIFRMDFTDAVSAVGFGTVELDGLLETIRAYNGATLIMDVSAPTGSSLFDYIGLVADGGDVITRVELEGNFFAIQNIQFNKAAVPEPAGIALLGLGLVGLALRRKQA